MKVSLEISMYPLDQAYEQAILSFIGRLQTHDNLIVNVNSLSTHVFGEYDDLMAIITKEIKTSFAEGIPTVMVLKLVNLDRELEEFS